MKAMTADQVNERTNRFYSHFCGIDILMLQPGMHFVCSTDRDAVLKGLGRRYTLYSMVKDGMCITAYSPAHSKWLEPMKTYGQEAFIRELNRRYALKRMCLMQFSGEKVRQYGNAVVLRPADYPLYEAFFRAAHPDSSTEGWLYEYFAEKAAKGYFTGYRIGNRLLSVCDAPDMPYMEGEIQHTGVYTLQEARGKGYARCTAALAVHMLLTSGICPQWECHADNLASIKLARAIGYIQYGTAYILEE